ncbi:GDSL-type esterase/lipase family protein [Fulvivirga sp. M361]|uniref:GDSL-type esterase/lipase family protein n=1 Tax=Fulvivirga sp. M361 TaxID=2594266 RepID=UPI0016281096|nr:GDSL-type esterase/lipase family protein [Fulvivirga sp. M361]
MRTTVLSFLVFTLGFLETSGQQLVIKSPVKFLALGDSYTIGQSVPAKDRWPAQLTDSLVQLGFEVEGFRIIARTGWTTGNLLSALDRESPDTNHTLVSLLIGVNDQFQGSGIGLYNAGFRKLLSRAIAYADGDTSRVFVLSIPDYAFTPFGGNNQNISTEIDEFNALNRSISENYKISYFDITDISRRGLTEPGLVASDELHPSGAMYELWVGRVIAGAELQPERDIETVTSADRKMKSASLRFFPNPVQSDLYLEITGRTAIKISTMSGQILKQLVLSNSGRIPTGPLNSGLYLLQWNNKKESGSAVFMKN